ARHGDPRRGAALSPDGPRQVGRARTHVRARRHAPAVGRAHRARARPVPRPRPDDALTSGRPLAGTRGGPASTRPWASPPVSAEGRPERCGDVGFWGASSDRRRRRSRPERRRPAGMTGSGALPDVATARAVVADADALAALLAALAAASAAAREQVRAAFGDSREEKVLARLDTVDVASLRDVTRERL